MSRYCQTDHCRDCICRRIANVDELIEVISDPVNNREKRRHLVELLNERRRLKDDFEKIQ